MINIYSNVEFKFITNSPPERPKVYRHSDFGENCEVFVEKSDFYDFTILYTTHLKIIHLMILQCELGVSDFFK